MDDSNFVCSAAQQIGGERPELKDFIGGIELFSIYINQRITLNLPLNNSCREMQEGLNHLYLHEKKIKSLAEKYHYKSKNAPPETKALLETFSKEIKNLLKAD
jgi:hypothetical protein